MNSAAQKTVKRFIPAQRRARGNMPLMKSIEIFRAGTHTDMAGVQHTFTEADLQASAESYNAALHEAPLVIGHPKTDAPAWGWVDRLAAQAGRLIAIPKQVQTAFAEQVQGGAYKKVSAAFYTPTDPHNPAPGKWYLRHVGFLGAQPPAVKGLAAVEFAEDDTAAVAFEEAAPAPAPAPPTAAAQDFEKQVEAVTAALANARAALTTTPAESQPQENQVTPEEAAALKAQNDELLAQLKAAQEAADKAAVAARHKDNVAFAEKLAAETRIAKTHVGVFAAALDAVTPTDGAPAVEFAEGETKTPLHTALRAALAALPARVEFAETATADRAAGGGQYAEGTPDERIALDQKIRAHMAAHKTGYAAAYSAVTR